MDFSKVLKELEKSPLSVPSCFFAQTQYFGTARLSRSSSVSELDFFFFIKFVVNWSVFSVDNRVY